MMATLRELAKRNRLAQDMLDLERQAAAARAQFQAAMFNLEKLASEIEDTTDAEEVRDVKRALEREAEDVGIGDRK